MQREAQRLRCVYGDSTAGRNAHWATQILHHLNCIAFFLPFFPCSPVELLRAGSKRTVCLAFFFLEAVFKFPVACMFVHVGLLRRGFQ